MRCRLNFQALLSIAIALFGAPLSHLAGAADLANTDAIHVTVDGQVLNAGPQTLPPLSRLADAVLAAGVRADAYLPGAIWLHQSEITAQKKLKIGLIYDLTALVRNARLDNLPERVALGLRLRSQVEEMPVTGRLPNELDPIRLELDRQTNHLLNDGDALYYPARPETVTIQGAVTQDCVLPFVSQKAAADYARACPLHSEAETDWLYIIAPDGNTRLSAIGVWNAEKALALQPGSRLLVPLRSRPGQPTDELNGELARFFATQNYPDQGGQP